MALLRVWLGLCLFWVVFSVWRRLSWEAVLAPLAFGAAFYAVWAMLHGTTRTFDLAELRQSLAPSLIGDPETWKTELDSLLRPLESKYGSKVPISELPALQNLVTAHLAETEKRRQEIIDQAAKEGSSVEIETLRRTAAKSKAAYTGPDREGFIRLLDNFLDSLAAKYGSRIPIDHAYRIQQDLEAGTTNEDHMLARLFLSGRP